MFLTTVAQYVWLLLIMLTADADAVYKVFQTPEYTKVIAGVNIIFNCTFRSSKHNPVVDTYWWIPGKKTFLQSGSNSRMKCNFDEGKSSLELLSTKVKDSGVYYCGMTYQGNRMENGTGSRLVVHASPAPLWILTKIAEENSSAPTLICKTTVFFPGSLTFTWYEYHTNIMTEINPIKNLNSERMFEASTNLVAPQPAQSGAIYTCVAFHVTLQNPAMAVYIDGKFNPSSNYRLRDALIFRLIFGFLIVLLLSFLVADHFMAHLHCRFLKQ